MVSGQYTLMTLVIPWLFLLHHKAHICGFECNISQLLSWNITQTFTSPSCDQEPSSGQNFKLSNTLVYDSTCNTRGISISLSCTLCLVLISNCFDTSKGNQFNDTLKSHLTNSERERESAQAWAINREREHLDRQRWNWNITSLIL